MPTKIIEFLKLPIQYWPRAMVMLGVVITFCWIALLAYGVMVLISWAI